MRHVRDAGHADFERDGDLLLDVFSRAPGPLRDDGDIVVGDVGVSLDGEVVERDSTPHEEQDGQHEDDEPAFECEIYNLRDH